MALLQMALESISLHKSICPPCWYYQLQKTEKYYFSVHPSGIMSMTSFIQISPVVLKLNHADRQTWPPLCVFILCTSCKEYIIKNFHQSCTHDSLPHLSCLHSCQFHYTSIQQECIYHSCKPSHYCGTPCYNIVVHQTHLHSHHLYHRSTPV